MLSYHETQRKKAKIQDYIDKSLFVTVYYNQKLATVSYKSVKYISSSGV